MDKDHSNPDFALSVLQLRLVGHRRVSQLGWRVVLSRHQRGRRRDGQERTAQHWAHLPIGGVHPMGTVPLCLPDGRRGQQVLAQRYWHRK
jgi:hypothetical protein